MSLTKRIICFCLTALMIMSSAVSAEAMRTPVTEITLENILAVLDEYAPDDAYIVRNTSSYIDPCVWWEGGENFLQAIDTCVHEHCHMLTWLKASSRNSEYIYLGNGTGTDVRFTETFHTELAAPEIPNEYRSFRYDTYVGSPSPDTASNVQGVYGLLNEFTAYHRGMCVDVALFDYAFDVGLAADDWFDLVSGGANNRLAFAEFNYYILFYLNYAREHYPEVYSGIMGNETFVTAYKDVHDSFVSKIAQYDARMKDLTEHLTGNGERYHADDDWYYIGRRGTGIFTSDYKKMMGAAEAFSEIAESLLGHSLTPAAGEPEEPATATDPVPGEPAQPDEPVPEKPEEPAAETDPVPGKPEKPSSTDPDPVPGVPTPTDAQESPTASEPETPGKPSGETALPPGDVDGDGEVTSGDARLALRASVKLEQYEAGSAAFLAADVDGSGAIESSDARTILRVSVRLETF